MSLQFVPSTEVFMVFITVAVNKDIITAPTRTQIIPNTRPGTDFGVTSPYLRRSIEKNNKEEQKHYKVSNHNRIKEINLEA